MQNGQTPSLLAKFLQGHWVINLESFMCQGVVFLIGEILIYQNTSWSSAFKLANYHI